LIKQTNNTNIMPRSKVTNPFKEQRNVWLHYSILIAIALGLTLLVVHFFPLPSTSSDSSTSGVADPVVNKLPTPREHNHKSQQESNSAGDDKRESHAAPPEKLQRIEEEPTTEEEREEQGFHPVSHNEFPSWLHQYYKGLEWPDPPTKTYDTKGDDGFRLNRDILSESLRLGCTNIALNQNEGGNFNYQYDFVKRELDPSDSAVRQAGALWGISLCYQNDPSNVQYQTAVENAIQFFMDHSVEGPTEGTETIRYPDQTAKSSSTGVNALFGLGMIEYLRTIHDSKSDNTDFTNKVRTSLGGIVRYLKGMHLPNKHFANTYYFASRTKSESSSAYYDGETMLCLIKAAKYIDGFADLIPLVEESAPFLAKAYSIDVWVDNPDSDNTKGFYQWSSMFYTEYYQAGWSNAELYGDFVLVLGHWILYTHKVLRRPKNTGYAFEGIISAYEIAKSRNHEAAMKQFERDIDNGLYKLTTWQVGGPLSKENKFLVDNPTSELIAIGGIMNARDQAPLRIDTTQHQMHALMMAMTSVYRQ
jgi:hypothetical protein